MAETLIHYRELNKNNPQTVYKYLDLNMCKYNTIQYKIFLCQKYDKNISEFKRNRCGDHNRSLIVSFSEILAIP